jgi:hypothetical protein
LHQALPFRPKNRRRNIPAAIEATAPIGRARAKPDCSPPAWIGLSRAGQVFPPHQQLRGVRKRRRHIDHRFPNWEQVEHLRLVAAYVDGQESGLVLRVERFVFACLCV